MPGKILIISPTPTHPVNAGNRIRILNMASFLIRQGHEVHFLYSRQEEADEEAMRNFWGERFYAVDYKKPAPTKWALLRKSFMTRLRSDYQYYSNVDDHYNMLLDDKIKEILAVQAFDTVLVEYIFLSRAFLNFGPEVRKVIDTHDVMTDRHKLFLREGKKPVWYSVPRCQERKGVRRADVVIAIQEREKVHFQKLTHKPVVNVGHIVKTRQQPRGAARRRLLFVGSGNPSNFYAVTDLLERDFPMLRNEIPGLELLIAGNICSRFEKVPEGVVMLGETDDLDAVYDKSDLVINPLTVGTGLKIKMIEAMGLAKVVFSTAVGAEGLEPGANKTYLLYHDTRELINQVKALLESPENFREIRDLAIRMAVGWNARNEMRLNEIFNMGNNRLAELEAQTSEGSWDEQRFFRMIASTPETSKFVIISIPRSGSNMLVGMLGGHREIACYPELFHPKAIYDGGAHRKASLEMPSVEKRNAGPVSFLDYMFRLGTHPRTTAIGFKIFPGHHEEMLESLIKCEQVKKIVLIRDNFFMNYISLLSASESNVFFKKAGSGHEDQEPRFQVDFDQFLDYEKAQKEFFAQITRRLDDHDQKFFMLHYQDILSPESQKALLEFLGVTPEISMLKVKSEKQIKLPLEEKILNFNEIRDKLLASGRGDYLKPEL